MRIISRALIAALFIVLVPVMARAQGSIAGAVKDSSGAVLPGVTVEAHSDALIEKMRTAAGNTIPPYTSWTKSYSSMASAS